MTIYLRVISIFIFIFIGLPSISSGSAFFEFKGVRDLSGWQFENVDEAAVEGGDLVIKGNAVTRIISPPGLNIPSSANVVRIRLRSRRDALCLFSFGTLNEGNAFQKPLKLRGVESGGTDAAEYRVYLGDLLRPGDRISGFGLEFRGMNEVRVKIDSIRFYEPTATELFGVFWDEFREPDFIITSTVNTVSTPAFGPVSFLTILYLLIVLTIAFAIIIALIKGKGLREIIVKAAIVSFLAGGFIFAVRMDYNWLNIWLYDIKTLSGKDVGERVRVINNHDLDSLLDFIDLIKREVPPGKKVAPAVPDETRLKTYARYYLLPLKTSSRADYLWVYDEKGLYFDAATDSLKKADKVVASPVRLFKKFGDNAEVYEVIK